MAPLIKVGNEKQLNDEDVWSLGYEFQHRLLHDSFRELKGTVLSRLIEANALDLIIISILSFVELFASKNIPNIESLILIWLADYSGPVFLQKILQSMEDPSSPKRAALVYASLSLIVRLISAQSAVFSLWYGRRCYERSRGEMVTMLYEKTLSRKVVSISSKARPEESLKVTNEHAQKAESSAWWRLFEYAAHILRPCCGDRSKKTQKKDELASMGKILNLMRFDAYEVAQRFWEFSSFITQPLGLVFSVVLIWKLIGWPCLIGVLTVFIAQGFNALIARILLRWEVERRTATDIKLQKISQVVESIRLVYKDRPYRVILMLMLGCMLT
jgi:hypothetical protein